MKVFAFVLNPVTGGLGDFMELSIETILPEILIQFGRYLKRIVTADNAIH